MLVACAPADPGSDAGTPDAGPGEDREAVARASIEGYCGDVAERLCAGLVSCGCDLSVRGLDPTTCANDRKSRCLEALSVRVLPDLVDGTAVLHDTSRTACLTALESDATACGTVGLSTLPPACARVFQASVAIGSTCVLRGGGRAFCAGGEGLCVGSETSAALCTAIPSADKPCIAGTCADGFWCALGVCKPRVSGEGCGGDEECVEGERCFGDGRCRAPAAAEGSCGRDVECAAGLRCVEGACVPGFGLGSACLDSASCGASRGCSWDPEGRKCAVPVAAGGDCIADRECASGAACDTSTGKCVALPKSGEACLGGYLCAPGFGCSDGERTCVALPGDGETCFMGDRFCAPGLGCNFDTNQCVPGGGNGEACVLNPPDSVCAPGFGCMFEAEGSFCRPLGTTGDTCTSDGTCVADLYCDFENGTCQPRLADGAACPAGNGCASGSECARVGSGWKCRRIPVFGERCEERCSDDSACRGAGGKCTPTICGVE